MTITTGGFPKALVGAPKKKGRKYSPKPGSAAASALAPGLIKPKKRMAMAGLKKSTKK